jgi:hypothetical protein
VGLGLQPVSTSGIILKTVNRLDTLRKIQTRERSPTREEVLSGHGASSINVAANNATNLPVAKSAVSLTVDALETTDADLNFIRRYYWLGTKCYDLLAGAENIESSYFLTRSKALDAFPMLKKRGLLGALVYYG